jgi:hypothetical protein
MVLEAMSSPHDTDPPPPGEQTSPGVVAAGRAQLALASQLAVVSKALGELESAILQYDATAQGIGRALDSTAK